MTQLSTKNIKQFQIKRERYLVQLKKIEKKYIEYLEKFALDHSLISNMKLDCEDEAVSISLDYSHENNLYIPEHLEVMESLTLGRIRNIIENKCEKGEMTSPQKTELLNCDEFDDRYSDVCQVASDKFGSHK